MVLVHGPSTHFLDYALPSLPSIYIPSFIQMPPVVIKLFAGQGTRRMDRRTKQRLYASPFGEHKKIRRYMNNVRHMNAVLKI